MSSNNNGTSDEIVDIKTEPEDINEIASTGDVCMEIEKFDESPLDSCVTSSGNLSRNSHLSGLINRPNRHSFGEHKKSLLLYSGLNYGEMASSQNNSKPVYKPKASLLENYHRLKYYKHMKNKQLYNEYCESNLCSDEISDGKCFKTDDTPIDLKLTSDCSNSPGNSFVGSGNVNIYNSGGTALNLKVSKKGNFHESVKSVVDDKNDCISPLNLVKIHRGHDNETKREVDDSQCVNYSCRSSRGEIVQNKCDKLQETDFLENDNRSNDVKVPPGCTVDYEQKIESEIKDGRSDIVDRIQLVSEDVRKRNEQSELEAPVKIVESNNEMISDVTNGHRTSAMPDQSPSGSEFTNLKNNEKDVDIKSDDTMNEIKENASCESFDTKKFNETSANQKFGVRNILLVKELFDEKSHVTGNLLPSTEELTCSSADVTYDKEQIKFSEGRENKMSNADAAKDKVESYMIEGNNTSQIIDDEKDNSKELSDKLTTDSGPCNNEIAGSEPMETNDECQGESEETEQTEEGKDEPDEQFEDCKEELEKDVIETEKGKVDSDVKMPLDDCQETLKVEVDTEECKEEVDEEVKDQFEDCKEELDKEEQDHVESDKMKIDAEVNELSGDSSRELHNDDILSDKVGICSDVKEQIEDCQIERDPEVKEKFDDYKKEVDEDMETQTDKCQEDLDKKVVERIESDKKDLDAETNDGAEDEKLESVTEANDQAEASLLDTEANGQTEAAVPDTEANGQTETTELEHYNETKDQSKIDQLEPNTEANGDCDKLEFDTEANSQNEEDKLAPDSEAKDQSGKLELDEETEEHTGSDKEEMELADGNKEEYDGKMDRLKNEFDADVVDNEGETAKIIEDSKDVEREMEENECCDEGEIKTQELSDGKERVIVHEKMEVEENDGQKMGDCAISGDVSKSEELDEDRTVVQATEEMSSDVEEVKIVEEKPTIAASEKAKVTFDCDSNTKSDRNKENEVDQVDDDCHCMMIKRSGQFKGNCGSVSAGEQSVCLENERDVQESDDDSVIICDDSDQDNNAVGRNTGRLETVSRSVVRRGVKRSVGSIERSVKRVRRYSESSSGSDSSSTESDSDSSSGDSDSKSSSSGSEGTTSSCDTVSKHHRPLYRTRQVPRERSDQDHLRSKRFPKRRLASRKNLKEDRNYLIKSRNNNNEGKDARDIVGDSKNEDERPLKCDMCRYSCKIPGTLRKHKAKEHPDINRNNVLYSCTQCSYVNTFKEDMKKHIEKKHEGRCSYMVVTHNTSGRPDYYNYEYDFFQVEIPYPCRFCNYVTTMGFDMQDHMYYRHRDIIEALTDGRREKRRTASDQSSSYYICRCCDFQTRYPDVFDEHVSKSHAKRTYRCNYCSYTTLRKCEMNKHKAAIHETDSLHVCNLCSFRTTRKSHLSRHILLKHTNDYVFACRYCNYKTTSTKSFSHHVQMEHT